MVSSRILHFAVVGVKSPMSLKNLPLGRMLDASGRTFPHHSRSIPRLSTPSDGAEFSRLRLASSAGRMDRIATTTGKSHARLCWRKSKMHARPEVREILIGHKLWRWALIGKNPNAFPNRPASRARRNYARLFARYEALARRLGLTPVSAYPPL